MKKETLMGIAKLIATESHALRRKVGAIFEKEGRILSVGYNGTPPGKDNCCEVDDKTKQEVIHAEMNLFGFMMREGIPTKRGNIYVTTAPCIICAKLVLSAEIDNVYYEEDYRDDGEGLKFLESNNINCEKIEVKNEEHS